MPDAETYHLKIDGQGVAIERDIPKDIGDRIIVLLLTGRASSASSGSAGASGTKNGEQSGAGQDEVDFAESPDVSLREYIDKHNAKRNPDMITAIAYYMQAYSKRRTFRSADLNAAFGAAAEPVPKNVSRDLKWAVRVGWIAQQPGRNGEYYVTKTGKDAVDTSFPKSVIRKTKVPAAKRKAKKA